MLVKAGRDNDDIERARSIVTGTGPGARGACGASRRGRLFIKNRDLVFQPVDPVLNGPERLLSVPREVVEAVTGSTD
jgi:hypothetical protein